MGGGMKGWGQQKETRTRRSHHLCLPSYPEVFIQCSGYYGDDGILPQGLQPHRNVWEGMYNFLQKKYGYCVRLEVKGAKCKVKATSANLIR